mmetsp:Transcript_16035/g.33105  ORF Transcript_16035/g.33105 Transcript_16035/m.33105 type:complete len:241 (+) Transcript_16035:107-829(+)
MLLVRCPSGGRCTSCVGSINEIGHLLAIITAHICLFLLVIILIIFFVLIFQPIEPVNGLNDCFHLACLVFRRFIFLPESKGFIICKIELVHRSEHGLNDVFIVVLGKADRVTILLNGEKDFHLLEEIILYQRQKRTSVFRRFGPSAIQIWSGLFGFCQKMKNKFLDAGNNLFLKPRLQVVPKLVSTGKLRKNIAVVNNWGRCRSRSLLNWFRFGRRLRFCGWLEHITLLRFVSFGWSQKV